LLEPRSFDACKNTAASIIVILGHLKIYTEVSDTDMETMKSDDCIEVSKNDRDTNGILAVSQEGVRFSYKDR